MHGKELEKKSLILLRIDYSKSGFSPITGLPSEVAIENSWQKKFRPSKNVNSEENFEIPL